MVQIGEFPAGAPHDITGIVKFTSPTTIVIENFNFDGAPPGIFFFTNYLSLDQVYYIVVAS